VGKVGNEPSGLNPRGDDGIGIGQVPGRWIPLKQAGDTVKAFVPAWTHASEELSTNQPRQRILTDEVGKNKRHIVA
jgi:hypothetical protein